MCSNFVELRVSDSLQVRIGEQVVNVLNVLNSLML